MKCLNDNDPDAIKRFQRESRILSTLDHPGIIKIVALKLQEPPLWYIMPLYSGSLYQELESLVGDRDRIHTIFDAILEGVQYAHEQGVIHRDLKPENILINSDNDVVVTDFGLGRSITAATTRATYTGMGMGTFGYMAPEQITDAKTADHRADIYALGQILYQMYTGNPVGFTPDFGQVPPEIVLVIQRCTKIKPEDRFQSVAELRTAIESIRQPSDSVDILSQIDTLVAETIAQGFLKSGKAETLAGYLMKIEHDDDLMRELVIKLPESAIGELWHANQMATTVLVRRFSENIMSQGWGFNYTDVLGEACCRLYRAVPNPEIRGILVQALIEVGVDHNRWHVLGLAGGILERVSDPAEGLAIATLLADNTRHVRGVKPYVELVKVRDRNIRTLFK